jgi:hypothetical protein
MNNKILQALGGLLLSVLLITPALAATITFDDMATGEYSPSFDTPQGYEVSHLGFGFLQVLNSSGGGNYLYSEGPDVSNVFTNTDPFVTLKHSNGQAFSLQQLDVHIFATGTVMGYPAYARDVIIRAEDELGNLIATKTVLHEEVFGWRTVTFDNSWTGIAKLELGSTRGEAYGAVGGYDNIFVTSVPIPAAVWLFGSALAGLGWLRRRQAV